MDRVRAELGGVDMLAASAGVVNRVSKDTVVDLTEEAWDSVLAVDAKGVWLGMRAVIPSMLERGGGRIVNISSLAAHKGLQGLASYSAAAPSCRGSAGWSTAAGPSAAASSTATRARCDRGATRTPTSDRASASGPRRRTKALT